MTKGDRIRQVREKLHLTQAGFAQLLGSISRGAVGNWERDQGIKEENIELISEKTGVSYEWLATGRGSMDPNEQMIKPDAPQAPATVQIPDLNIFGGMGGGGALSITATENGDVTNPDDLRGYWSFPDYALRAFKSVKGIYAWEVRGDSMLPTLAGGAVVFVDTSQNTLPPDDIYACDYGDGLVVKRLRLIPRTDKVQVISDNDKYPADELLRDEVNVWGRVVGWFQWRS